LPYSPLGFGTLSGKYLRGAKPENSRLTLFPAFARYLAAEGAKATEKYVALARAHDLLPEHLALAYVRTRPFVASTIIGATTLDQLTHNLDSVDVNLDEALLKEIESIHREHTYPCP